MMIYWATFILGLGSTLHCLSMCGPFALLMPKQKNTSDLVNFSYLLIYHVARIASYILIGLVAGSIGKLAMVLPEFVNHQKTIAIVLGLVLLILSLLPSIRVRLERIGNQRLHKLLSLLMQQYRQFKTENFVVSSVLLGIIHGLLPCGIVYSAAMMAMLTGSVVYGSLAMLTFGIATSFSLTLFRLLGSDLLPYLQGKWIRIAMVSLSLVLLFRSQQQILDLSQLNKPVPVIVANCHK